MWSEYGKNARAVNRNFFRAILFGKSTDNSELVHPLVELKPRLDSHH